MVRCHIARKFCPVFQGDILCYEVAPYYHPRSHPTQTHRYLVCIPVRLPYFRQFERNQVGSLAGHEFVRIYVPEHSNAGCCEPFRCEIFHRIVKIGVEFHERAARYHLIGCLIPCLLATVTSPVSLKIIPDGIFCVDCNSLPATFESILDVAHVVTWHIS